MAPTCQPPLPCPRPVPSRCPVEPTYRRSLPRTRALAHLSTTDTSPPSARQFGPTCQRPPQVPRPLPTDPICQHLHPRREIPKSRASRALAIAISAMPAPPLKLTSGNYSPLSGDRFPSVSDAVKLRSRQIRSQSYLTGVKEKLSPASPKSFPLNTVGDPYKVPSIPTMLSPRKSFPPTQTEGFTVQYSTSALFLLWPPLADG
ncbi:hypothetical protein GUJ93_ZPchr0011g28210 [Zizania palustris]|uniref:Uncharacterized protein n=1 Tax=Zizania palustris TaxID=103762 RepID=A0A8J6BP92_ZIZPA|nr:hypothetical protein GUJ93_ZPchr0011g28210 [Zizania palustris]